MAVAPDELAIEIEQSLDSEIDRVRRTAQSSPAGGDTTWQALLGEIGVQPLPDEERTRHVTEGPQLDRGAPPIEVRHVLEALESRVRGQVRELEDELHGISNDAITGPAEAAIERIERRLSHMVDAEMRAYVTSVRPTITTSSIFANAMATSTNYMADSQKAGVDTVRCPCCGAPRLGEDDSTTCKYCGGQIISGSS